jgi:2-C-methyl-D-erythritol 4-phosphate cytidylyltransferase
MNIWAIVVAGGTGSRYGGPKHAMLLDGIELWLRCVQAFHAAGVMNVVVVGDVPGGTTGGQRRRDSVANGLAEVPASADWILIHDAARPLVTPELVTAVMDRVELGDADAVIPVTPMTDTLKRVKNSRVLETLDRASIKAVQTPQAFRAESLRAAHEFDRDADVTDDAGLVERIGGIVVTIAGDQHNMKVTFSGDLEIAQAILKGRRDG